jgi:hypothetical protein
MVKGEDHIDIILISDTPSCSNTYAIENMKALCIKTIIVWPGQGCIKGSGKFGCLWLGPPNLKVRPWDLHLCMIEYAYENDDSFY